MRCLILSLVLSLALLYPGQSEVVWTEEQMKELEYYVNQLEQEHKEIALQLKEQSRQMQKQEMQLKAYKTLSLVLGGAIAGIVVYEKFR